MDLTLADTSAALDADTVARTLALREAVQLLGGPDAARSLPIGDLTDLAEYIHAGTLPGARRAVLLDPPLGPGQDHPFGLGD